MKRSFVQKRTVRLGSVYADVLKKVANLSVPISQPLTNQSTSEILFNTSNNNNKLFKIALSEFEAKWPNKDSNEYLRQKGNLFRRFGIW